MPQSTEPRTLWTSTGYGAIQASSGERFEATRGKVWEPIAAKMVRKLNTYEDLLTALRALHDETADYIKLNCLGATHHNRSMQQAKAALDNAEVTQ